MKKIGITIELIEPLIIKSDFSTSRSDSLDYIPGSVLRGAIAYFYLRLKDKDDFFIKCFDNCGIIFPNLYPFEKIKNKDKDKDKVYKYIGKYSFPFPSTACSCKRHKGFRNYVKDSDEEKHGVRDVLFKKMRNEDIPKCICSESLTPINGFYNVGEDGTYLSASAKKKTFTHTAINYKLGTVEKSQLYSFNAILEDQFFRGDIIIKDDSIDFDRLISTSKYFKLGKGRTRGYGKVKINVEKEEEPESREEFYRRIRESSCFNSSNILIITLLSDAIILDEYLRYMKKITPGWLMKNIPEIICKDGNHGYRNYRNIKTYGWNAVWGLPKPGDIAIEKGGVFTYELEKPLSDSAIEKLYNLQINGIGIRREEGFGRISINDRFHFDFREEQK